MVGKFSSTYLLVAHGSRDPRPQQALEKLAKLLSERLARWASLSPTPTPLRERGRGWPVVGTATLEFGAIALREQICQFGEYTRSLGLAQVQLVPLFLLPGVHVQEDIPSEVVIAQSALGPTMTIDVRPHLGSHTSGLAKWMVIQKASVATQTKIPDAFTPKWILLSHGTRRLGGNSTVEEMADQLGAQAAYWSVSPSLEARVKSLVGDGHRQIGILPYFLLTGGITDAIAQTVEQLQQQFPLVKFHLANPLDANISLADLVLDLVRK